MFKYMSQKTRNVMHVVILITVIIAIVFGVVMIMVRYEEKGETNMPFQLKELSVISKADGIRKDNPENKWDIDVMQNNDVYLQIEKNTNYNGEEAIDNIELSNIQILQTPQVGEIKIFRPSAAEGNLYTEDQENLITDHIKYQGTKQTNLKTLELTNQGGIISFRIGIRNLGNYVSNEDTEVRYDGTLLDKMKITNEQLKTKISFDIIISTKSEKQYKGTIPLEIPVGDIVKEGVSNMQKTDFSDIIFKRL